VINDLSFPLRYQVAVALVGLNVIGTVALATFAYRASRASLESQAARTVAVAAHERDQALVRFLQQRHDRLSAFLGSVESLCGERSPSGKFDFERECVRVALSGFQTAEHAEAAELSYGGRQLAARGSWEESASADEARPIGQLATISEDDGDGFYTMGASRQRLAVRVRLSFEDVDAIFQDRSGLNANGEIFLTDTRGSLLTTTHDPRAAQTALSAPVQECLSGETSSARTVDNRGDMIRAFRPVPAFGGGCIVASLPYADVLVPIHQLARQFVLGSLGFMILGAAISVVLARTATKPIARLAEVARELEAEHFDRSVPIAGPSEVRQLGRALSSMARSVGDLVQREHEARLEAEAANRTKDDFLAMLSHELRSPLTSILGWSTIMKKHRDDDEQTSEGIEAIELAATRQAHLVEELLDVSRIVTGKVRLNMVSQVSLTRVVGAALEEARPLAEAKQLIIVKRLASEPLTIAGDAGRLQQVLGNLLSNAVKFTPAGGQIEVELTSADESAEIRVTDTGIGIAPEFLPHVFERFRQADSSSTRAYGGLGLGLSIAQHFVELHGGGIHAESKGEGYGATFVVRLPCHVAAGAASRRLEPIRKRSVPPLLDRTRILVVDDDPDIRAVVRAILEDAGATVETTGSAAETRETLEQAHPDVLIADIGMPREDGYSLIRSIRTLGSDDMARVPAIALTAHARPEDAEQALAAGFQMHLTKPIDSTKLLSAVTTTLVAQLEK
jgi:signal transduction histidine kinase/ActR/RegA family two-component response regulator